MTTHYFIEILLSVAYINIFTHISFYFIDLKNPEFTFVDAFAVNLR